MNLKEIKQEIAALLNVDSVTAKTLYELANSNQVVLSAIKSIDALQFNLRTIETWKHILSYLQINLDSPEGVNEDLGVVSGGVTGNNINQDNINQDNTEFVYLANCWTYLLEQLGLASKKLDKFSDNLFSIWFDCCKIIHGDYIKQPIPSHSDYLQMIKLLQVESVA